MSLKFDSNPFDNPYDKLGVVLTPISDEIQTNQNLEPQMVRIRAQNSAIMYLDAVETDIKKNISKKLNKKLISTGNIFTHKVKRIGVDAIGFFNGLQNVIDTPEDPNAIIPPSEGAQPPLDPNLGNNEIVIFSSVTGTIHRVYLSAGIHTVRGINTPPSLVVTSGLMFALQTVLNFLTPLSGLIFTISINVFNPLIFNISSAGGTFFFVNTSTAVKNGRPLWNLPALQVLESPQTIGAVWLMYTRFIDFISREVVEYTKNPFSSNTKGANNIIFRLFLRPEDFGQVLGKDPSNKIKYMNYNRNRSITSLEFELRDEFGQLLQIPSYAEGTDSAIFWNINLATEI